MKRKRGGCIGTDGTGGLMTRRTSCAVLCIFYTLLHIMFICYTWQVTRVAVFCFGELKLKFWPASRPKFKKKHLKSSYEPKYSYFEILMKSQPTVKTVISIPWSLFMGSKACIIVTFSIKFALAHSFVLAAYFEALQDKLAQLKDARDALDALRDEHREKRRREEEERERQRQIQMAKKLEVLRQKKQVRIGVIKILVVLTTAVPLLVLNLNRGHPL